MSNKELAQIFLKQGYEDEKKGEYVKAIENYERVAEYDPENYEAWFLKAHCQKKIGRYKDSETLLIKLINDPKLIEAYKKDPKKYESIYGKIYMELASLYRHKQMFIKENEILMKADIAIPNERHIQRDLAYSKYARKDFKEACKLYAKLVTKYPNDENLKLQYAQALNKNLEFDRADQIVQCLIDLNPNRAKNYEAQSQIYKWRMKYKKALESTTSAFFAEQLNTFQFEVEKLVLKYYLGEYQEVIDKGIEMVETIYNKPDYFRHSSFNFYYASAYRNLPYKDKQEKERNMNLYNFYMKRYEMKAQDFNEEYYLELSKAAFENKDLDGTFKNLEKAFSYYGEEKTDCIPLLQFYFDFLKLTNTFKASEFYNKHKNYLDLYEQREVVNKNIQKNDEETQKFMKQEIQKKLDDILSNKKDEFIVPKNTQTVEIDSLENEDEDVEQPIDPNNPKPFVKLEDADVFTKLKKGLINSIEIGKGGYGTVKLAINPYSKKMVAQKTLIIKEGKDKKTLEASFRKEVMAMVSCNHRNLVPILGNCMDPMLIDMEYEEGGELSKLLEESKNLSLAFKFHLMKGFLQGLNYLHNLNPPMIHCDIKTENILLDKKYTGDDEKTYPTPKISDFGLTSTQGERLTGYSPRWTAPEILWSIRNGEVFHKSVDTDIFSAGMVLYSIMTQRIPYGNLDNDEADEMIMKGTLPSLDNIEIDNRIIQMIRKCLQFCPFNPNNPNNTRSPNIASVIRELEDIEKDIFNKK